MNPGQIAKLLSEDIHSNNGLFVHYRQILEGREYLDQLLQEFPTLRPILEKYLDVDKIRLLGDGGSHGIAFTDESKVVKITDDKSEAIASSKIAGKQIKGINNIWYVGRFSRETPYHDAEITTEKVQYYVIVQDLLNINLSAREKQMSDIVGDYITDIKWPINVPKAVDDIYIGYYRKHKQNIMSVSNTKIITSLLNNLNALYQHGITYLDVRSDNVGKDQNGNLVLFDLGVSVTKKPSEINII
jgi:serine/threonine protein kinase